MPEQAVFKPPPRTSLSIFFNCDKVYIPEVPFFQLTRMSVMMVVHLSPIFKWYGAEKTTYISNYLIPSLGFEKGLMSTIVLYNENSDQEKHIDNTEDSRDPNGPLQTKIHKDPKAKKGEKRGCQL